PVATAGLSALDRGAAGAARSRAPALQLAGSLFFTAFLFLWTFLHACVLVTAGVVMPFPRRFAVARAYARGVLRVLKWSCGLDYRVEGAPLPAGSHVALWKHSSSWETIAMMVLFPRRGMFPERDVGAGGERCALDAVVEPAAPLEHPQHPAGVGARHREAAREGHEHSGGHQHAGMEEGPEEQEGREEERAGELQRGCARARSAGGSSVERAQPGSRDRSATPANSPRGCARRLRRFARSSWFSSMTITESKNASTAGRSCASRPS